MGFVTLLQSAMGIVTLLQSAMGIVAQLQSAMGVVAQLQNAMGIVLSVILWLNLLAHREAQRAACLPRASLARWFAWSEARPIRGMASNSSWLIGS